MAFIAAPLLWGLTAAGVPVFIHLTGRAKPIVHRFPAMRFILRSQRASSRTLRIKHLLILLLRVLTMALIALALARPLWQASWIFPAWLISGVLLAGLSAWAFMKREFLTAAAGVFALLGLYYSYPQIDLAKSALHGDFVLILDRSMSMSYQEPSGETRLEIARKQAAQLLSRLSPQSRTALIFATDKAERIQGRLSLRHDDIAKKLQDCTPSGRSLDINIALQAAREILSRESSGNPATVVFFTDIQANAVDSLLARGGLSVSSDKIPHNLVVVDIAADTARNGGIIGATLPGSILPPDSVVTLTGRIRPVDRDRSCLVELYIDGNRLAQKLFEPKGQDVAEIEFNFKTGAPGPHSGRLFLAENDSLPMDQDYVFTYESGHPPQALILENPPPAGEKGAAFFLSAALQAGEADSALNVSGLKYFVESPGELDAERLSKYKAVIVPDGVSLNDSSWSALQKWTDEGGGLFIWAGPNSSIDSLKRYQFQEFGKHQGLLPCHFTAIVEAPKPLSIIAAQIDHPLLAHVNPAVATTLREAHITRFMKVAAEPRDTSASVVLSLSDGSPFIIEKSYGQGRVLLATVNSAMEGSDLPKRGEAFVTLVLDGIRLLAARGNDAKGKLGAPMVLTLPSAPADKFVIWRKPDQPQPVLLPIDLADSDAGPANSPILVNVPPLESTGLHTFTWTAQSTKTTVTKIVAVNPDPSESDMRKASAENISKALAGWQATIVKDYKEASIISSDEATGSHEFAAVLLVMLGTLMLAESFLSNRLYRDDTVTEETDASSGELATPVEAGERT